jgi:hypothetical protein
MVAYVARRSGVYVRVVGVATATQSRGVRGGVRCLCLMRKLVARMRRGAVLAARIMSCEEPVGCWILARCQLTKSHTTQRLSLQIQCTTSAQTVLGSTDRTLRGTRGQVGRESYVMAGDGFIWNFALGDCRPLPSP